RGDHRRGGARRVLRAVSARGDHPRLRVGPRRGPRPQAGARGAGRDGAAGQPLGTRRQGHGAGAATARGPAAPERRRGRGPVTDRFISDRYAVLFRRLADRREGAFIPFLMLGDPTPELSRRLIEAAIAGGADALELGIPFSDPIADGPTLQTAAQRALAAGVTPDTCFAILREV